MAEPAQHLQFLAAFESTFQPTHDVDVTETTGHVGRWREDLELVRSCGLTALRYPIRWHRVERERGRFDWAETDRVLGYMADVGLSPIVDLVHHTSYPLWLKRGFADSRFGAAFLRYVEAFARRYPWIEGFTLFNEPFTTFFLCGYEGVWAPNLRGLKGFLALALNVMPALTEASRICRELLPAARHLYVDACERASAATEAAEPFAELANDRRFFLTDLFLGRPMEASRPFVAEVLAVGGEPVLELEPGFIDVLGLDYYAHNQWQYLDETGRGVMSSPAPAPLSSLVQEYWERYRLPCSLGETNIRGYASDRASWLKYTLEQCEMAGAAGVPLESYCWFPFVDSCDWDSLLFRSSGNVDPVGVYWLDEDLERRPSSMSDSYRRAVAGTPARDLPAYRFQEPVVSWLRGWLPQMGHWDWVDPPAGEVVANAPTYEDQIELKIRDEGP